MRFKLVEESNFINHNQNPNNDITTDCVLRAISFAYNKPYEEVISDFKKYNLLPDLDGEENYKMRYNIADIISAYGYTEYYDVNSFPHDIDEKVENICLDYPEGTWIVGCTRHLTVVKDGKMYDTHNPSKMKVEEIWRVA